MTSLNTVCKEHTPLNSDTWIEIGDDQFSFCKDCEKEITRWYDDTDSERLPMWTDWKVSK